MQKNLSDVESSKEIIARLRKLNDTNTCRWGSMSLNGMLCHCAKVNLAILEGKAANKTPSFKQRFLKNLVLYVMEKLPKGIKTNPKLLHDEQQILETDTERNNVIDTISRFTDNKNLLGGEHPVFGKLNDKEWGRFAWIHLDHHLRQFGV